MSKFNLTRDINGYNGFGLPFADDCLSVSLVANVGQSFTIPGSNRDWIVVFSFSPGSEVWVANNFTASLPVGVIGPSTSELNPTARKVISGDVISMITSESNVSVGITLYAL